MLKKLQNYKNIRKLFFSFFLFSIINIGTFADSQLKEIPTIEEYSRRFLDENFVLEDLKKEQEEEKEEKLWEEEQKKYLVEQEKFLKELNTDKNIEIQRHDTKKVEQNKNFFGEIKEINNLEDSMNNSKLFPIEVINLDKKDTEKKLKETNRGNLTEKKIKEQIKLEPKKIKRILKKKEKNIDWELEDNFRACLIGDLKGNVYFSKNADKLYPLASVTKVMTLLVTFDAIHAKKISLNSRVTISANAARQGGSKIRLKAGQVYRLKDLIKASAIYSANNATYAIAEFVGQGSLKRFVRLMNKKVRKLGLQKSLKYYTPAGLPSRMTKKPMDSGTARAIYKLSIEALKYKDYIQIAGIKRTTIRNGTIKLRNRNHLLGKHGVYGIKTGYHKEARYNITVASKIKNKRVIVVVLGGKTYKTRDKTVLDMLNIFENNYYTLVRRS